MNFLMSILICGFWYLMLKWFKNNTCVMNNHIFKFQKKAYICQKCGLIKRVVKHD
jgi:hypothetical protein